jgi:ABC-type transport system involved in multi-copper enzyme maturation permease subunit
MFTLLMSTAFSWFDSLRPYLPMQNLTALARATSNLGGPPGLTGYGISTLHASIVVCVYVVVFASIAAVVFRKRDIGGITGG